MTQVSPGSDVDTAGSRARRVATVDVGTNSIRLLVAEARADGGYRLLADEKVVCRLGRGMTDTSMLDPEAMQESARAIAHMRTIAEGYGAEVLRAVATCAVREAENRDEFLALVRDTSGVEVEVISGEEEARLAFLSARSAFDLQTTDAAVIDIGGGSTEVVVSSGGIVEQIASLALGAVRLTEAVRGYETPERASKAVKALIRREVKARLKRPTVPPRLVIGTGGTFTTLASMDLYHRGIRAPGDDAPARVRGHELTAAGVRRWHDRLVAMTPEERAAVPGLGPDRVDIIVAGLAITIRVMKRLGANALQVHDRGIRDGVLLGLAREIFPDAAAPEPTDRLAAVRVFARACHYEEAHSEHVTRLALDIHEQLVAQHPGLPKSVRSDAAREILHAAGVLHDIGYFINYHRHHKHSYHLILHSELRGFRQRELELVANVARYHRRAHPKASHGSFARLTDGEKMLVGHLAAILRIADGLDRAHASRVEKVSLTVEAERLTAWFDVHARDEPEVDLWGAARKSRLFTKVFGLEPRFEWVPTETT